MSKITKQEIEKISKKTMQSVRHLMYKEIPYAIYITNRFRKIGWMAIIKGEYYGVTSKLELQQKDDIIDYYVTMKKNAEDSIEEICKK